MNQSAQFQDLDKKLVKYSSLTQVIIFVWNIILLHSSPLTRSSSAKQRSCRSCLTMSRLEQRCPCSQHWSWCQPWLQICSRSSVLISSQSSTFSWMVHSRSGASMISIEFASSISSSKGCKCYQVEFEVCWTLVEDLVETCQWTVGGDLQHLQATLLAQETWLHQISQRGDSVLLVKEDIRQEHVSWRDFQLRQDGDWSGSCG